MLENSLTLTGSKKPRTKILIVEDEPQWQLILSSTVKQATNNPEIVFAESAKSARSAIASSEDFDLVLSDFFLEGNETGLDLWRTHRTSGSKAPFILISGKSSSDIRQKYRSSGRLPQLLSKLSSKDQLKRELQNRLSAGPKIDAVGIFATGFFLVCAVALLFAFLFLFHTLRTDMWAAGVKPAAIQPMRPGDRAPTSSPPKPRIERIINPETKERIDRIARRASEINYQSSQAKPRDLFAAAEG